MAKKQPLVSILIVNWNGKVHLETCLLSLFKITYKNTEVVVVDQGSTDGSREFISKKYPNVKLVELDENFGFARGNNIGLEYVKGELVLLLNNDTLVEPGFLEPLVSRSQNKKVAIIQPKICFWNKRQIQSTGSFMTTTGFLFHRGYGADIKKYNDQDEIFSANGACMLVKTNIARKLGLFDNDYFAYFEETDFCWRVWLSGYLVSYEPSSLVYHKGGQTAKTFASAHVQYLSFRNRIYTILKNMSFKYLIPVMSVHIFFCFVNIFAYLLKGRVAHSVAVLNAILWNLRRASSTHKKHKCTQKSRRVSDDTLFRKLLKNPKISYYLYLFTDLTKYEKHS